MRVVVTNATEDAGLTAVRSLAEAGCEVYGIDTRSLPRSMASRYLTHYEPLPEDDERRRHDRILRYIQRSQADVFLPIGTRGVLSAIRHRKAIEAVCAVNVVDADAFRAAFEKQRCMRECERLGIPCAGTYSHEAALDLLRREPSRTLVVKPSLDVGAASGVTYVRDVHALDEAVGACTAGFGGCLIQDFIPGDAEKMKTVILLFSRAGGLAASFTTQKVRHWPTTGGPTACSRSTDDRALVDIVLPFFRKWAWRGPAEVELKLDPRDNRHKVIEINPRFPGYLRFPWHCGLDLPLRAVRLALDDGEVAGPMPTYRVGETYVAPTLFLSTVREEVTKRGWRTAVRRAMHDARGSGAVIRSMLADPLPLVVRTLSPTRVVARSPHAALEGLGEPCQAVPRAGNSR